MEAGLFIYQPNDDQYSTAGSKFQIGDIEKYNRKYIGEYSKKARGRTDAALQLAMQFIVFLGKWIATTPTRTK